MYSWGRNFIGFSLFMQYSDQFSTLLLMLVVSSYIDLQSIDKFEKH